MLPSSQEVTVRTFARRYSGLVWLRDPIRDLHASVNRALSRLAVMPTHDSGSC
jgi:hypothetical protein